VRNDALDRDDYRCRICNKNVESKAHVHHRVNWKEKRGKELDDVITVCKRCHEVIHTFIKKPGHLNNIEARIKAEKKFLSVRKHGLEEV